MELWMSIIGVACSFSSLPQVIKLVQTKESDDISIAMLLMTIFGLSNWVIYGVYNNSISLILTCSICVILKVIVLALALKYRTKKIN